MGVAQDERLKTDLRIGPDGEPTAAIQDDLPGDARVVADADAGRPHDLELLVEQNLVADLVEEAFPVDMAQAMPARMQLSPPGGVKDAQLAVDGARPGTEGGGDQGEERVADEHWFIGHL